MPQIKDPALSPAEHFPEPRTPAPHALNQVYYAEDEVPLDEEFDGFTQFAYGAWRDELVEFDHLHDFETGR